MDPLNTVLDAAQAANNAAAAKATIAPSAADIAEAKWSGLFGAWIASHVADSPIARNTDAYNHLIHVALPALRANIMEIF